MYRLYRDTLRRIYLMLLHYRDLGYNVNRAYEYSRDGVRADPLTRRALSFMESGDFPYQSESIDQIVGTLGNQIITVDTNHDRDLIDAIVRTVQLPYARNVLAGSTLTRLRQAVLLPEEVANLRVSLEGELHCCSCGHKFRGEEMASLNAQEPRGFLCTRCHKPSWIASDSDPENVIPIVAIKPLYTALMKKHVSEPRSAEAVNADMDEILGAQIAAPQVQGRAGRGGRINFGQENDPWRIEEARHRVRNARELGLIDPEQPQQAQPNPYVIVNEPVFHVAHWGDPPAAAANLIAEEPDEPRRR